MDLPVEVLRNEFVRATNRRHLGLAVSLTEQCNFRCTYCYETFELGAMSSQTYHSLKLFVRRMMPTLDSFGLSWFGGEPLLEWERMEEFTRHCFDLAKAHQVKMPSATVPTNAWSLTPSIMSRLCDAGVGHYMISLDGLQDEHDSTRKLISGKGTFERLHTNLQKLSATDIPFRITLRLHLHQENLQSQVTLVKMLAREFGTDERFTVHPIALGNFGGESIKKMKLLRSSDKEDVTRAILELFRPGTYRQPEHGQASVCYAAKPNHIFVRPNGSLAKCTSALDRADNNVGQLTSDGTLDIDSDKALLWSFGFRTGKRADLSCPFFKKPREEVITVHRGHVPTGRLA